MTLGFKPTTSGTATGSAPALEKIIAMVQATDGPLAVASGTTPENVRPYCHYLSDILVATGVSLNEHEPDESKLELLISTVNNENGRVEKSEHS